MNLSNTSTMPEYIDGYFDLYDLVDEADGDNPDFPVRKIKERPARVWYREVQIYDRTRVTFEQASKEVTMKIRIPKWKEISSNCVCMIENEQHKVFNKADVISKQGIPETELTLVRPERIYEVAK